MAQAQPQNQVDCLEFVVDQLTAELMYVDDLMRQLGFSQGIKTFKDTAQEIIHNGHTLDNINFK